MAEETIRVFNLNDSSLRGMRRKRVQPYVDGLEEDLKLLDEEESSVRQEFEAMLAEEFRARVEETKYDEYSSTISDFYRSKM